MKLQETPLKAPSSVCQTKKKLPTKRAVSRFVLGIESSCDETAVAILRNGQEVLSQTVASQIAIHAPFGGVIPELASRAHLDLIDELVERVLNEADLSCSEIDAVAVTRGPGLIGALLVGISYARGLALGLRCPLIPVNHVHAHIFGALLGMHRDLSEPLENILPALALVVSGGHTNLYYWDGSTHFDLIARSVDDACGECFDKVAKLLDLPYPGGPQIESYATQGRVGTVGMPRMVEDSNKLFFSYAGLKTHMATLLQKEPSYKSDVLLRANLCASFQEEALSQLVRKIKASLEIRQDVKSVIIAGGVSANQRLRQLFEEQVKVPVFFPPLEYCSDNAAMIASYGDFIWQKNGQIGEANSFAWDDVWDAEARIKE